MMTFFGALEAELPVLRHVLDTPYWWMSAREIRAGTVLSDSWTCWSRRLDPATPPVFVTRDGALRGAPVPSPRVAGAWKAVSGYSGTPR